MKKIAVIYASRTGTTEMLAKEIAKTISDENTQVDVKTVQEVSDLNTYDAFIVGASVRRFKLLSEADGFLFKNKELFSNKPVSFFFIGYTMDKDTSENRDRMMEFIEPTLKKIPLVNPESIGLFAGILNIFKILPFLKVFGLKEPPKDYKDWDKVREWAKKQKMLLLK
jgi:menaquinone-dependent protoporphyrinogen oxidase